MIWVDRFLMIALVIVVTALSVTAIPTLSGQHLGGAMLLGHMMASGVLVIGLPVFALAFVRFFFPSAVAVRSLQLGYLATVATGVLTIATVFLCMLPIPSTEEMHWLMKWHGRVGFAMIPAVALLVFGRSVTQSASRPRS